MPAARQDAPRPGNIDVIMRLSALLALAAVACLVPSLAGAQLKRIPAEIVPLVERDGVGAGTTVRAALQVTLPEGSTSSRTRRATRRSSPPS